MNNRVLGTLEKLALDDTTKDVMKGTGIAAGATAGGAAAGLGAGHGLGRYQSRKYIKGLESEIAGDYAKHMTDEGQLASQLKKMRKGMRGKPYESKSFGAAQRLAQKVRGMAGDRPFKNLGALVSDGFPLGEIVSDNMRKYTRRGGMIGAGVGAAGAAAYGGHKLYQHLANKKEASYDELGSIEKLAVLRSS